MDMAEVWNVVTTATSRAKTLFSGLEKDARKFVENNFPRPHVEPPGHPTDPGQADVKLVGPGGQTETYHAEDGWSGQASASTSDPDTSDRVV